MTSAVPTQGPAGPTLRTAAAADLGAVERLLAAAHLPTAGVAALFERRAADFVVAEDPAMPNEVVGVAGLEVCGDAALLRSVAVHPAWQARHLGRDLVHRVVKDAHARRLRALYLLTTTAERYFPRFGFERVERGAVPAAIAATVEFQSACPASAVAMRKELGADAPGG